MHRLAVRFAYTIRHGGLALPRTVYCLQRSARDSRGPIKWGYAFLWGVAGRYARDVPLQLIYKCAAGCSDRTPGETESNAGRRFAKRKRAGASAQGYLTVGQKPV